MPHPRFLTGLSLTICLLCSMTQAEPAQDATSGSSGEAEFTFDESVFADAFLQESDDVGSWRDGFTVRITQQLFGQINNHHSEPLPGVLVQREAEVENNRLGINVRYQYAPASGWLLQASGQARVYWRGDYEFEANGDFTETEYRINEFFVQRSYDKYSLKFGRQTVVWGETTGNSVLDVINHIEFRDLTIIDIEDARLNQWMLVWDYFGQTSNVSTFVTLYPEFNPPPVRGSPFYFEPAYRLTDYQRGSSLLFEVGTQVQKSFQRSDISVMAAWLYQNQPRYSAPPNGMGNADVNINDYFLLGFSANRAIGKLLLNIDLAISHGVVADTTVLPNANLQAQSALKKDQLGISFGFEYAISNEQNISLGIAVNKLLDATSDLAPGQSLLSEEVFGTWLMRYSNSLLNSDLLVSATLQGDLAGENLLVFLAADYTVNDNWAVNGQIILLSADSSSRLALFDEDVRAGITVSYSF
jgi:hypothetical protein